MVFSNMPSLLSRDEWIHSIIEIVEIALRDERVEVREKAGQVLSGLLHCEFIRGDRKTKLMVCSILEKYRRSSLHWSILVEPFLTNYDVTNRKL